MSENTSPDLAPILKELQDVADKHIRPLPFKGTVITAEHVAEVAAIIKALDQEVEKKPSFSGWLGGHAKAIVSAIIAGLAVLSSALDDSVISGAEIITIIATVLGTGTMTFIVPNASKSDPPK